MNSTTYKLSILFFCLINSLLFVLPGSTNSYSTGGMILSVIIIASVLLFTTTSVNSQGTCRKPMNFPAGLSVNEETYNNWSNEVSVSKVFFTSANTAEDVVKVANWAKDNNYNVRPSGNQLSWSPMTVNNDPATTNDCKNIIIVRTRPSLTKIEILPADSTGLQSVRAEAGATLEEVLEALEKKGLGLGSYSSLGSVTLGGYLAVGGHGTGVPNGAKIPGLSTSSLSNMILSLDAAVWQASTDAFELQTIDRSDPRMSALMASLGRIFITAVTLRVGPNQRFRCQSSTEIAIRDIFAKPSAAGSHSLESYVKQTGYVGILYFPFNRGAWLRIFSRSPEKPASSREVTRPYNYIFQEGVFADAFARYQNRNSNLTPYISQVSFFFIKLSLCFTRTRDLWGWSKNVNLVVSDKAPKVSVSSFAVLTSQKDLQRVGHEMFTIFETQLNGFGSNRLYPINAPVEFRITSTDMAEDAVYPNAKPPIFTATSPVSSKPSFDVVIWMDITTFAKTEDVPKFLYNMQSEFLNKFDGTYAIVRPEWSKRWAYTQTAPWENSTVYNNYPELFDNWTEGNDTLLSLDPKQVFSNGLLKPILA